LKFARGARDVQQVNIPALYLCSDGMTELCSLSGLLDFHFWFEDAGQANPAGTNPRTEISPALDAGHVRRAGFQEKFLGLTQINPYRKTDTGRRGE